MLEWLPGEQHAQRVVVPIIEVDREAISPGQHLAGQRPDVTPALNDVLQRLLAKKPEDRFAAPAELIQALAPFVAGANLPGLFPDKKLPALSAEPAKAQKGTEEQLSSLHVSTLHSDISVPVLPMAQQETAAWKSAPGAKRRKPWLVAAAAALLLAAGGTWLAPQIIIRIKGKDGQQTEIKAAPGADIEIEKDGKVIARVPGGPDRPPGDPVVIKPEPLPPLKGGEPLSPMALVSRPATIKGIRSWSPETRGQRGRVYALAYSPDGRFLASGGFDGRFLLALLVGVATHVVGDRPGRVEPREVKRRRKVKLMTKPRAQRRAELLKSTGTVE